MNQWPRWHISIERVTLTDLSRLGFRSIFPVKITTPHVVAWLHASYTGGGAKAFVQWIRDAVSEGWEIETIWIDRSQSARTADEAAAKLAHFSD